MSIVERFWEKVDRRGPDECWPWTAGTDVKGYGKIRDEGGRQGRTLRAHRVSYEIYHGSIVADLQVQHSCDNPPCCNPAHLSQGTPLENMQYKVKQCRQARGEKIGIAKLTEEKITEIRRDYVRGSRTHGQPALARKYGVGQAAICNVVNEKTWKLT